MKVLFVLSIGHVSGGAVVVWLSLLDELSKRGVKPYVLMPRNRDNTLIEALDERGIPHFTSMFTWWTTPDPHPHSFKRKVARAVANTFINSKTERKIARLIRDEGIDLVFINDGTIEAGRAAAHEAGVPIVWHVHEEIGEHSRERDFIESDSVVEGKLAQAAAIITVNRTIGNDLQKRFPSAGPFIPLYNGLGPERLGTPDVLAKPDCQVLTLAGRVDENKGQRECVEAFGKIAADFPQAELNLVGVGTPEFTEDLKRRIEATGFANRIHLRGRVDDMPAVWTETDIAFNCSWTEGCPMIIVEALLSGCAMIVSNCTANVELLGEGRGLLYERRDADELADCIRYALSHPDETRAMAGRSKAWATEAFSIDKQADAIYEIFSEALA